MTGDKYSLNGKVAIVSGGGRGVGEAIALTFAEAGADVVVTARTKAQIDGVAKKIEDRGRRVLATTCDISKSADSARVVQETLATFGKLDILVNCAAFIEEIETLELNEEQWHRVMDVNVKGTFFFCQAAAKAMIPQGGGTIINISSTAGYAGAVRLLPYCTSKSAIHAMTRLLAVEWGQHKVRVVSVSPGGIDPEMGRALAARDPEGWSKRPRRTPLGGLVQMEDVTNAVMFMATEQSRFITGRDIIIDGGLLIVEPGGVD